MVVPHAPPCAPQLKAQADQLEAREEAQAAEAQQLRQGMEGAKLQAQCTREAEALHKKLQVREGAGACSRQPLQGALDGANNLAWRLQAHVARVCPLVAALQASYSDHMLTHERELDKLMKRTSTSKLMLTRTQAHQLLQLEQALKGWFNPRKASGPQPLGCVLRLLACVC